MVIYLIVSFICSLHLSMTGVNHFIGFKSNPSYILQLLNFASMCQLSFVYKLHQVSFPTWSPLEQVLFSKLKSLSLFFLSSSWMVVHCLKYQSMKSTLKIKKIKNNFFLPLPKFEPWSDRWSKWWVRPLGYLAPSWKLFV